MLTDQRIRLLCKMLRLLRNGTHLETFEWLEGHLSLFSAKFSQTAHSINIYWQFPVSKETKQFKIKEKLQIWWRKGLKF